jgi:hypothetical protein
MNRGNDQPRTAVLYDRACNAFVAPRLRRNSFLNDAALEIDEPSFRTGALSDAHQRSLGAASYFACSERAM